MRRDEDMFRKGKNSLLRLFDGLNAALQPREHDRPSVRSMCFSNTLNQGIKDTIGIFPC